MNTYHNNSIQNLILVNNTRSHTDYRSTYVPDIFVVESDVYHDIIHIDAVSFKRTEKCFRAF